MRTLPSYPKFRPPLNLIVSKLSPQNPDEVGNGAAFQIKDRLR